MDTVQFKTAALALVVVGVKEVLTVLCIHRYDSLAIGRGTLPFHYWYSCFACSSPAAKCYSFPGLR
jgi:hypothetical protein